MLVKMGVTLSLAVLLVCNISYSQDINEEIAEINHQIEHLEEKLRTGTTLTLSENLIVRSRPGIRGNQLDWLRPGDRINITGYDNRYFKIVYDDGKTGYVSSALQRQHPGAEEVKLSIEGAERKIALLTSKKAEIRQNSIENITDDLLYSGSLQARQWGRSNLNTQVMGFISVGDGLDLRKSHCPWYEVNTQNTEFIAYKARYTGQDVADVGWVHQTLASMNRARELTRNERAAVLRRREYVENNPGIDDQFREDILKGTVRVGMTRDMVMAARGEPSQINRAVTEHRVSEHWIYNDGTDRIFVFMRDGMITAFHH